MAYTFLLKKNNAKSTLSSGISGSDTNILVTSLIPFPISENFLCTIWNKSLYPDPSDDPNMEIVKVTDVVSGNTFVVTRAQEGTLARSHSTGYAIEHLITAGTITEIETQINDLIDNTAGSGWVDDGSTVRLSTITDKVGVGTISPTAKFQVVGATASTIPVIIQTSDDSETNNAFQLYSSASSPLAAITPLGRFLGSGSATRPAFAFIGSGNTTSGFYGVGSPVSDVRFTIASTDVFRLTAGSSPGFQLASGGDVTWSSGSVGSSSDTGLSRVSAGLLQTTNGNIASPTAAGFMTKTFFFDGVQVVSTGGSLSAITPTSSVIKFTAATVLNGFTAPSPSYPQVLFCINDKGSDITVVHEQGSLTAATRIHLEGSVQYLWPSNQVLIFIYDTDDSRWKCNIDQVIDTANYVAIFDSQGRIDGEAQLAISRGGTNNSSFTDGSVLYYDGTDSRIDQDNSNFFFNDVNLGLGIGVGTSPDAGIHADAMAGPGVPTSPTSSINYAGTGYDAGTTPHNYRFYGKSGSLFSSTYATPTTISSDGLTPTSGENSPDISSSAFSTSTSLSYHVWPLFDSDTVKGGSLTINGTWSNTGGDNGTGVTNQGSGQYSPGDTLDYQIYALFEGDTTYYPAVFLSMGGFSEGGDIFDVSVSWTYSGSGTPSSYIIERQVNSGGFNDYQQVGGTSLYDDNNNWNSGPPSFPSALDYNGGGGFTAPTGSTPSSYRIFRDKDSAGYVEYKDIAYGGATDSFSDDDTGWTAGDEGVDLPASKQYSITLGWANASGVTDMRILKSDGAGHSYNYYDDFTGTSGTDDNTLTAGSTVTPNVGYAVHGQGGSSLFEPNTGAVIVDKDNTGTTFSDETTYHLFLNNDHGSPRSRIGFKQGGTVRGFLGVDSSQNFLYSTNGTHKWITTIASTTPSATLNATGLIITGGVDTTANARLHARGGTPLRIDNSSGTSMGGVDSSFNPFFGASGVSTTNGSVGRNLTLANTNNNNTVLHLQTGTTTINQGGVLEVSGGRTGADARIGQWNVRYNSATSTDSTGQILMQINNDSASLVDAWMTIGNATVNALTRFGSSSAPTAIVHLRAGTTTASTAPLKFDSGSLLSSAEVGAVEFLTDKWYATITTGTARKELTLNDIALTSGRVPFITTNGRLTDDSDFTFATDTLTVTKIAAHEIIGNLTFSDAINIVLNATTGTKIATATTQKLSFWNSTPIVQPSTTGTTAGYTANASANILYNESTFTGNTGSKAYTVSDVIKALKDCGIMAAS